MKTKRHRPPHPRKVLKMRSTIIVYAQSPAISMQLRATPSRLSNGTATTLPAMHVAVDAGHFIPRLPEMPEIKPATRLPAAPSLPAVKPLPTAPTTPPRTTPPTRPACVMPVASDLGLEKTVVVTPLAPPISRKPLGLREVGLVLLGALSSVALVTALMIFVFGRSSTTTASNVTNVVNTAALAAQMQHEPIHAVSPQTNTKPVVTATTTPAPATVQAKNDVQITDGLPDNFTIAPRWWCKDHPEVTDCRSDKQSVQALFNAITKKPMTDIKYRRGFDFVKHRERTPTRFRHIVKEVTQTQVAMRIAGEDVKVFVDTRWTPKHTEAFRHFVAKANANPDLLATVGNAVSKPTTLVSVFDGDEKKGFVAGTRSP